MAPSKWRRVRDEDRKEDNNRCRDLIQSESHFNFIKMHLPVLIHFGDPIRQFGNIPMYSTENGDLAHKEQIKDPWRRSNKNDVARQILQGYSH